MMRPRVPLARHDVVARTLYRDLSAYGLDAQQIVAIATALLGEVADQLAAARAKAG